MMQHGKLAVGGVAATYELVHPDVVEPRWTARPSLIFPELVFNLNTGQRCGTSARRINCHARLWRSVSPAGAAANDHRPAPPRPRRHRAAGGRGRRGVATARPRLPLCGLVGFSRAGVRGVPPRLAVRPPRGDGDTAPAAGGRRPRRWRRARRCRRGWAGGGSCLRWERAGWEGRAR